MISFIFASKSNENLNKTIHALLQFKNISVEKLSDEVATIKMPETYFEVIGHSLEYWGIVRLV